MKTRLLTSLRRAAPGVLLCSTLALASCGGGGSDAALAGDTSTSTHLHHWRLLVYAINASTGAIAATASTAATGTGPIAMTVDAAGSFAYVANYFANSVSVYRITATTGALTAVTGSPFLLTRATGPISVVTPPAPFSKPG